MNQELLAKALGPRRLASGMLLHEMTSDARATVVDALAAEAPLVHKDAQHLADLLAGEPMDRSEVRPPLEPIAALAAVERKALNKERQKHARPSGGLPCQRTAQRPRRRRTPTGLLRPPTMEALQAAVDGRRTGRLSPKRTRSGP